MYDASRRLIVTSCGPGNAQARLKRESEITDEREIDRPKAMEDRGERGLKVGGWVGREDR